MFQALSIHPLFLSVQRFNAQNVRLSLLPTVAQLPHSSVNILLISSIIYMVHGLVRVPAVTCWTFLQLSVCTDSDASEHRMWDSGLIRTIVCGIDRIKDALHLDWESGICFGC